MSFTFNGLCYEYGSLDIGIRYQVVRSFAVEHKLNGSHRVSDADIVLYLFNDTISQRIRISACMINGTVVSFCKNDAKSLNIIPR